MTSIREMFLPDHHYSNKERLRLVEFLAEQLVAEQPAADLVRALLWVREECDRFAEVKSALEKAKSHLEHAVIPSAFGREGLKTITLEDEQVRVSVQSTMRASVVGDRNAAMDYLRSINHEEAITTSINASSLSRVARELAEEGTELPDDLFKSEAYDYTSVTKIGAK